ncbi:uncharacterized protein PAC_19058 [Phialocephala subalpina]|uniref:Uncharacterized protein n=1 Tax=Phialocephala subalpina TaxID=576137 RepID=A0A1L7XVX9_9HELO|nr:uncharacterized protein PAC_19058 [Phialocephala subalpina]
MLIVRSISMDTRTQLDAVACACITEADRRSSPVAGAADNQCWSESSKEQRMNSGQSQAFWCMSQIWPTTIPRGGPQIPLFSALLRRNGLGAAAPAVRGRVVSEAAQLSASPPATPAPLPWYPTVRFGVSQSEWQWVTCLGCSPEDAQEDWVEGPQRRNTRRRSPKQQLD